MAEISFYNLFLISIMQTRCCILLIKRSSRTVLRLRT